ncbi:hypothetical protein IAI10_00535 [Clostridium sp. 19966]|uniref:hypothetical protein n=1 Tax=Clostridium sp. 19966 TaxID=2768166 RepID=UPI0028DF3DAE|nr:hypothetical protein [Clostridium sp. 19966]MDT8715167.1 hypothetical protein [Clostridium sp. 19966]
MIESTVLKKMRLKEGIFGIYLYAPKEYIEMCNNQNYVKFHKQDNYGFVHLFIESQNDYKARIEEALALLGKGGVLWISYPKSDKKNKYDVNRDILFKLTQENGYIACSSVALNEKWAAMRFKPIE